MDRLTCDRCGSGLLLDAPVRYEVRIEVKSAYDPLELTEEDLAKAAEELKRAIERLNLPRIPLRPLRHVPEGVLEGAARASP